jgi:hypothetical protein
MHVEILYELCGCMSVRSGGHVSQWLHGLCLAPLNALKQVCAGPRTTRPYKLAHGWYCLSGSQNEATQGLWKKLITLRRHMNSNSDSAAHLSNTSFSISEDSVFLENGSPRGKV